MYFCFAVTTVQSVTKERKEKSKAKKSNEIKMLIDVSKSLQIKGNVDLDS